MQVNQAGNSSQVMGLEAVFDAIRKVVGELDRKTENVHTNAPQNQAQA